MAHVATITIDQTKVAGDLTDYVGLIVPDGSAGYAELYALCLEGGGDIRLFKSDDTTELAREIVSFSVTSETGEIHYKYSGTLSSSADTDIHVYADGFSADYAVGATYGRNAVWNSGYVGVWHQQSLTAESTATQATLTNNNSVATTTGKIGGGADFGASNTNKTLTTTNALGLGADAARSFSMWVNISTAAGALDIYDIFGMGYNSTDVFYIFEYRDEGGTRKLWTGRARAGVDDPSLRHAITFTVGQWYKLDYTIDASRNQALYIDGVSVASNTAASGNGSGTTFTGTVFSRALFADTRHLKGKTDEARVNSNVLSANWFETEYNNQNSPSTFQSVAAISSGLTQALTASITAATSIVTANKWSRALTASATGAGSITNIKSFLRTLSAAVTGAVTISRANLLFVTMTAAVSAATTITTESINAVRMRVTAAATATIEKTLSMTQTLTASTQAEVSIITVKTFFQTLLAAVSGSAAMTATKTFFQTLTAAVAATGIVTRGQITFGVTLSAIIKVKAKLNELFYKKKYQKEDEDYKRKY